MLLPCLPIGFVYLPRYEAVEYGELRAVPPPGVPVLEVRLVGVHESYRVHDVESQIPLIAQAPLIVRGKVAQRFGRVKMRKVLKGMKVLVSMVKGHEGGFVEVCWGVVKSLGRTEI